MQPNRQWIERTLRHETCDAVPFNFMFSPPALRRAESHYGGNPEERLGFPIRMNGPRSVKPLYADPQEFGDTLSDEFGVVWSTSEIDRGSPIGPCLREPSLSGYEFPEPAQQYRFEHLAAWCSNQSAHYRIIWVGDLWERATSRAGWRTCSWTSS